MKLTWKEALKAMLEGKKIRRPGWHDYWYIDQETGIFTVHRSKKGSEEDITYGKLHLSIMNTAHDDWEVVPE